MDKLQWALYYVEERNLSVIPVGTDKKPTIEKWKPFQTRKPTKYELQQWFGNGSKNNIGIVTGAISGIAVVDFDSPDAVKLAKEKRFPQTPIAKTARGYHAYCRHKPGVGNFQDRDYLPGIDFRAEGGFVVAPPSMHETGKKYEWVAGKNLDDLPLADIPEWILAEKPEDKTLLKDLYAGVSKGSRNQSLARLAGSWVNDGLTFDECIENALIWNQKNNPSLPEQEIERTVRSIYETHQRKKPMEVSEIAHVKDWPDPPALEAFHGLAGEFVRTIEPHTEADPVGLLIQFLVMVGNIIGKTAYFVAEADIHYLNLFTVLVGLTSKGRKGSSWGHIKTIFEGIDEDWGNNCIQSGLSSGEGLIWAIRDPISKHEAVRDKGKPTGEVREVEIDHGVEDKRLLVFEPEFASALRVINRDGNTLSAIIRQAWDVGDLKTLTKNSPARATGGHISIIGHITRDELRRYLDRTESGNGFANRILWVCVQRSKTLPEGGSLQKSDLAPLIDRLSEAIKFARTAGKIKRNDAACEMWREVYPELSEGKPGLLGAIISRAEAQVMRLACLYALLDFSCFVRPEHLKAALALWEYCEASCQYIFGESLGDPVADEILRELRKSPEGLTGTDISNLFGRNKNANQLSRALFLLMENGLVRKGSKETKEGGRPAVLWVAI